MRAGLALAALMAATTPPIWAQSQPLGGCRSSLVCVFENQRLPSGITASIGGSALADLDGDGRKEVIFFGDRFLTAFDTDASGTVFLKSAVDVAAVKRDAVRVAGVAGVSINSDSVPDLAILNMYPFVPRVELLTADGAGGYYFAGSVSYGAHAVIAGDFNKDGRDDLAVAAITSDRSAAALTTLLSWPGGLTFGPTVTFELQGAVQMAVADFNRDTNLDVVMGTERTDGGSILVFLGNGQGGFAPPIEVRTPTAIAGIGVADFNADGRLDVAAAENVDRAGQFAAVSLNFGDGSGNLPTRLRLPLDPAIRPKALTVVDLNADGAPDLVVASEVGNTSPGPHDVTAFLNWRSGSLLVPAELWSAQSPVLGIPSVQLGPDGLPDLLMASADGFTSPTSFTVSALKNEELAPDLSMTALPGADTVFVWNPIPSALGYDVIRGSLENVSPQATEIDLGPVLCLTEDSSLNDTLDQPDFQAPAMGRGFFYLFRSTLASYGAASDGRPRVATTGDCP